MKKLVPTMILVFVLLATQAAAATVSVGGFGYHPEQQKQVIVYTSESSGEFTVRDVDSNAIVMQGQLTKPKDYNNADTSCQGGQSCLVGDISSLPSGRYIVAVNGDISQDFTVSQNIFSQRTSLLLEPFEAMRQQGSSYHADLHTVETPPFTSMADGSYIHTTYQAAFAGIRMASAYTKNPQLFAIDQYTINTPSAPDLAEHVKEYVNYVEGLQDHDGTLSVPRGYFYNFNCAADYNPNQQRYTTSQDPCLEYNGEKTSTSAVQALLLYAEAITLIHQLDENEANALLQRAINTETYIANTYPNLNGDDAAFYGAALFILHDYTGDDSYLEKAHEQRSKVNTNLDNQITRGREFYWEEYARHKQALESAGLQYPVNGNDPAQFFANKINNDWRGINSKHAISRTGEHVYILDENLDFQQSRFMLLEGVSAAKAIDLTSESDTLQSVADAQLAWLTGQNNIQKGAGAGEKTSMSFIFGIGNFGTNQHIRLVDSNFYDEGREYQNGREFIPGWISGAYDSPNDGDSIFNYDDSWHQWSYTETTNEMVAAALELSAYLDAHYNDKPQLARPQLSGEGGVCTYKGATYPAGSNFADSCNTCTCNQDGSVSCTQNSCEQGDTNVSDSPSECFATIADIPVSCTADVQSDNVNGACRSVQCSNAAGSIAVLGCEKGDGLIELYRQSHSGSTPQVCFGEVCLQHEGFRRSDAICTEIATEPPTQPPTPPSTEECMDVADLPAQCSGGSLVADTTNGACRTLRCESSSGNLQVQACNKDEHFEMYNQQHTDKAIDLCLGDTCLNGWGYRQGELCTDITDTAVCGNSVVEGTETCDDGNTVSADGCSSTCQSESSPPTGQLRIKEWYPQGTNYVFVCELDGSQYHWNFGDGHGQTTTNNDVYHSYAQAGAYDVSCSSNSQTASLQVTVS